MYFWAYYDKQQIYLHFDILCCDFFSQICGRVHSSLKSFGRILPISKSNNTK